MWGWAKFPNRIVMKFCIAVDIGYTITHANFGDHRFRLFRGRIWAFPIDFCRRTYNTLASCQCINIRVLATRFCVLNVFLFGNESLAFWSAVRNKLTFYLPPRRVDVVYIRCCANTIHYFTFSFRITVWHQWKFCRWCYAPCVLWIHRPKTAASVISTLSYCCKIVICTTLRTGVSAYGYAMGIHTRMNHTRSRRRRQMRPTFIAHWGF